MDKVLYKNVEILMSEIHHQDLIEQMGLPANKWLEVSLQPIVQTDQNGLVTFFRPTGAMSMGLVYFFQQLMLEQRCYFMDKFLKEHGVIK